MLTQSFKYDPFGRRIEKISPTTTSIFAYDGNNLVETANSTGGMVARYAQAPGIDQPLAMQRGSTTSFYEQDGLGSVTSLSNSSGALVQSYTYDSFGNQTASSGSLTNFFRYAGRECDTETGLYYYRARYYDSTVGRFIGEDAIGFLGGANFYAYVWNSPLGLADPFGFCPCKYQGKALSPTEYAARGKAFREEIDTMLESDPDGDTLEYAMGELYGDFHQGGPLDAQPYATGDPLGKASYGNYAFGAFFAGAGISLQDALSAANAYGLKQQVLNGAYHDRAMDPTYTHLPVSNVQDIINGYDAEIDGKLCGN